MERSIDFACEFFDNLNWIDAFDNPSLSNPNTYTSKSYYQVYLKRAKLPGFKTSYKLGKLGDRYWGESPTKTSIHKLRKFLSLGKKISFL